MLGEGTGCVAQHTNGIVDTMNFKLKLTHLNFDICNFKLIDWAY